MCRVIEYSKQLLRAYLFLPLNVANEMLGEELDHFRDDEFLDIPFANGSLAVAYAILPTLRNLLASTTLLACDERTLGDGIIIINGIQNLVYPSWLDS
jgi:hypothetical protein